MVAMRRKTREILVGNVGVGGGNPVRIQSMTTSPTDDVKATVDQILRLEEVGCEIARVTVQGKKEARACENIKNSLIQKGSRIPLVADIHFYPPAAMLVADFVDKVRVNPGNYLDRRATFRNDAAFDDQAYIEEGFSPLVLKCKSLGRAMRIGTNHGSLSDRIMCKYGDTPQGMVESAIEYAKVCRTHDYHNFLFSMKSSNPLIMIQAYRLLVQRMDELSWDYPLHLGVTEAGDGENGRIKSAVGIGALLLEGLGDTIRVSLTEDPWLEIDSCKRLRDFAEKSEKRRAKWGEIPVRQKLEDPYLHPDGSVVAHVSKEDLERPDFFEAIGCDLYLGRPQKGEFCADAIYVEKIDKEKKTLLETAGIGVFTTPHPAILHYASDVSYEDLLIQASAKVGAILADGIGHGVCIEGSYPLEKKIDFSFKLLQACRMRATKTEFISCPSCGRTLFDLQEVTQKIRERTDHLPGVKIAIMGCIVNGPGEMADAHFGYVGSGKGKIDLYVGKERVEKGIPEGEAVDRLIALIQSHGMWVEPLVLNS
ncbi:MAG: (E)-4-hydroxy-3-methylbut-2-enyl-diphosphate synthase [Candidatus Algichlamydia australiensis]|nr:(E)-4-hydroxy-3-methylbut-2-enyl-diphosphate synthase [Chlamydiales bacterium]